MAGRNGSGTYVRSYDFTADRDAGSPTNIISADRVDDELDGIATALTGSLAKDGQTTPTADLPMGGFKHTGVSTSAPAARSVYASVAAIQDNNALFIAGAGTADAITATFAPALTSLVNGCEVCVRAASANTTTTPNFAPNGLTAKTIVKGPQTALVAGDIGGNHHELRLRYNSTSDKWHLLNPVYGATGKQTIWVPAGAMVSRTTNGPSSGLVETSSAKVNFKTLDFDAATQEHAQFFVQMPKSWDEGTVTAVFVWSHPSTTTNFGVVWSLQAVALSDGDAIDASFGTQQNTTDTGGTTDVLYRSPESSAVTVGGTPAESDVVVFQVFRKAADAADTLAVDARLHGVAILFTNNTTIDN